MLWVYVKNFPYMYNLIYSDKKKFCKTLEEFKKDWAWNLCVFSDFDRTLTRSFMANIEHLLYEQLDSKNIYQMNI